MKKFFKFTFPGAIIFCLCSCVPLKEVGNFTACSQKTLQDVTLSYGSFRYCKDSCYFYNENFKNLKEVNCDCKADSLRDTIILNEFAILSCYYAGLTKLSGVSLINFGPLGKNVTKGTYGRMTVTDQEASVFNKLTILATNLVTLEYKNRKIKEIVSSNDADVQNAIGMLYIKIDNLNGFIGTMEIQYQTLFTNLIHDAANQTERILLANVYKQKIKELDNSRLFYNNLEQSINKILQGDKLLMQNINNLKAEGFKKSILSIAGDIIYLNSKSN